MTDDQIKHMTQRFLGWRLPETFNPDDGISFDPIMNRGTPYVQRRYPIGTNLFNAEEAEEMVRHMTAELPPMTSNNAPPSVAGVEARPLTVSEFLDPYDKLTPEQRSAMLVGDQKRLSVLGITREWFERRAALEGDLEVGAGLASTAPQPQGGRWVQPGDVDRMPDSVQVPSVQDPVQVPHPQDAPQPDALAVAVKALERAQDALDCIGGELTTDKEAMRFARKSAKDAAEALRSIKGEANV